MRSLVCNIKNIFCEVIVFIIYKLVRIFNMYYYDSYDRGLDRGWVFVFS